MEVNGGENPWGSKWTYGDLPSVEKIHRLSMLLTAMIGLLQDELAPFVDEPHTPEIVMMVRFPCEGKPLRVGVSMPDDTDMAINVVEDFLGAMHQQRSESA